MRPSTLVLGFASLAAAAESLCDKYTTALLKVNNATTQYTLLTLVVNTALIGNYTQPNVGIAVTGILNPGTYNGTAVNLLPYFTGGLDSSNRGGSSGVAINFLDDGGAAPLMKNMPSNGNMTSNQYMLVTHLYEFFGYLLGCSDMGKTGFSAYGGSTSMYTVHKFMDLSAAELGYFITQVGTAAASFGVTTADVTTVGNALSSTFGQRCAAAAAVPASATPALQAICIASDCPMSPNPTCAAYDNATEPMTVSSATMSATGSASASASASAGSGTSGADHLVATTLATTFVAIGALGFVVMLI